MVAVVEIAAIITLSAEHIRTLTHKHTGSHTNAGTRAFCLDCDLLMLLRLVLMSVLFIIKPRVTFPHLATSK